MSASIPFAMRPLWVAYPKRSAGFVVCQSECKNLLETHACVEHPNEFLGMFELFNIAHICAERDSASE